MYVMAHRAINVAAVGPREYAIGAQEDFGILDVGLGSGGAKVYAHPRHFYADFGSRSLDYIHVAAIKEWGVVVAFQGEYVSRIGYLIAPRSAQSTRIPIESEDFK